MKWSALFTKTGTDQNFWPLACIAGTALGLPGMVIGGELAKQYGAGTALLSICIGNTVLWLIGLGIISMVQGKNHAVENVRGYLGKRASIVVALIWMFAFLIWYAIQIEAVAEIVQTVAPKDTEWLIGLCIGSAVALMSLGNIQLIKQICVFSLPALVSYIIYAIAATDHAFPFKGTWGISFQAIFSVICLWLPGIVNLPTIFRHSASKDDSFLALSLMTLLHIFFQMSTILIGITQPTDILLDHGTMSFGLIVSLGFSGLSFLCINLVNIYFASAGWEVVIFRHKTSKEYLVVGLAGTAMYLFLNQFTLFPINQIETAVTSFIANLGVVLSIDFLIRIVVKHRPRPFEKFWSCVCWLVGCIASILSQPFSSSAPDVMIDPNQPFLTGIVASCLAFLIVLFTEETIWSIKNLPKNA